MIWRYNANVSHVLDYNTVQLDKILGFEEEPVAIVGRHIRKLRSKNISVLKVQWKGQPFEEDTWETGEDIWNIYEHLFGTSHMILNPFEDECFIKRWRM